MSQRQVGQSTHRSNQPRKHFSWNTCKHGVSTMSQETSVHSSIQMGHVAGCGLPLNRSAAYVIRGSCSNTVVADARERAPCAEELVPTALRDWAISCKDCKAALRDWSNACIACKTRRP